MWESPIFTADFFGTADTETGIISDSAWAGIKAPMVTEDLMESSGVNLVADGWFESRSFASCYGQVPSVCNDSVVKMTDIEDPTDHVMNAYGLLRSPWNMNAGQHIIRSQKNCGTQNNMQFPDCQIAGVLKSG